MAEKAEILIKGRDDTAQAWASVQNTATAAIGHINSLLPGLAAGLTAAGLVTFAKQALDSAEQLDKMSQRTGIAVEDLSKLKYAAQQSNVDLDKLAIGIKKMSTNAFEATDSGSKAAETFKLMGVSATDANGKVRPTNELMLDLAERFSKMQDGAAKSALAVRLFGKAGDELIPFLNQGRDGIRDLTTEAERLGIVITKDGAEAASKFNDSVKTIEAASKALGVTFVNELAPAIAQIAEEMRKAAVHGGSLYGVMIGFATIGKITLFGVDETQIQRQTKYVEELRKEIAHLEQVIPYQENAGILGRLSGGDPEKMKRDLAGMRLELQWAAAALEKMKTAAAAPVLPKRTEAPPILQGADGKPDVDELQKFIDKQNETADQLAAGYERTKALLGQITEEAKVRYDTEFGKLAIVDDAIKANLITRAKELDAANAANVAFEEARQAQITAIQNQTQQAEIAAENAVKFGQAEQARADAEQKERQDRAARVLDSLRTDREIEEQDYVERQQILQSRYQSEYAEHAMWRAKLLQLDRIHVKNVTAIEDAEIKKRFGISQVYRKADVESALFFANQLAGLMQTKSRALFEVGKAAAIVGAIIDSYKAATGSYAALAPIPIIGPALGAAAAAAALTIGFARVAAIKSTNFGTSNGGAIGTFAASPNTGLPEAPISPAIEPVAPAQTQAAQRSEKLITLQILAEGMFSAAQIRDSLIPLLNDAVGDGVTLRASVI